MEDKDIKRQLKIQLAINKILKEQLDRVLEIGDKWMSIVEAGNKWEKYNEEINEVLNGK